MIRVKISNFIKNNLAKIRDLGTKIIIVALVVLVATIMLSSNSNNTGETEDTKNIYKPTQTIIKGQDVSEQQYEKDSNTVEKFLNFCNNNQIEEAYNLLTEECKQEKYPTIEKFKQYYKDTIFSQKRGYNLQAWVSNTKYTVYKVRYINNMLETGVYESDNIYEDYITLNKGGDSEKISIGEFIYSKEYNKVTDTDLVQATVLKKNIYISYEEYELQIKNVSDKQIQLDNLETGTTLWLIAGSNKYSTYINKLFINNLTLDPGEEKSLTIRFKKNISSNSESKYIEFSKVIKDYETYKQNKENYTDTTVIKINVED